MSSKTDPEEEYFQRIEAEKKAALRAKLEKEGASAALAERKALHHMRCGKCGAEMHTQIFKGVEIEICEECGAVLLDPGELEELAGKDKAGIMQTMSELFHFSRNS